MNRSARSPVWLFDLDNTLHNADPYIFPQINRAMTAYLEEHLGLDPETAGALRSRYWKQYGATLLGLMKHHGTDPHHFLHHTHQFPNLAKEVVYERALFACLKKLPGRKILFSNAPRAYVGAVLRLVGIRRIFERIFTIEDLKFHPKPVLKAYRRVLRAAGVPASQCIMVEDTALNLWAAKRLGMRTVWISKASGRPSYVDVKLSSILDIQRAL